MSACCARRHARSSGVRWRVSLENMKLSAELWLWVLTPGQLMTCEFAATRVFAGYTTRIPNFDGDSKFETWHGNFYRRSTHRGCLSTLISTKCFACILPKGDFYQSIVKAPCTNDIRCLLNGLKFDTFYKHSKYQ